MPKVINLLSYHIAEDIERYIYEHNLQTGAKLPSERELAKHYRVTRATLRNAHQKLIDDGLLYNIANSGYFISQAKILRDAIFYFFPFADPLLDDVVYTKEIINEIQHTSCFTNIPLSNEDLNNMVLQTYIEKINDQPIAITHTLQYKQSFKRYPYLFDNVKAKQLTQKQSLNVYHPNDNEMQVLNISKNDSLFIINEFINDEEGLIAICESICVGSRCEVKFNIKTQ